jgi:hypothetical protein
MAIQILGNGGTIIGAGEEARKGLHMIEMPVAGNAYRYSGFTGTIGAALAASSELLQFRFVSGTKSFAIIRKVIMDGFGIVAVSTALGPLGWQMIPARGWTIAGSGGTRIAMTGDNLQMETAAPNSQVNDLGIATTGALTVGTKTKDANAIGQVGPWSIGTGAATTYAAMPFSGQPFLDASTGANPLVCANQEGFVIQTTHVGPATLTYVVSFTIDWVEVTAY